MPISPPPRTTADARGACQLLRWSSGKETLLSLLGSGWRFTSLLFWRVLHYLTAWVLQESWPVPACPPPGKQVSQITQKQQNKEKNKSVLTIDMSCLTSAK